MYNFPSLPPAERFAIIIEGMRNAIATRGGGLNGLPGPLLWLIWTRLRRMATRFTFYAATPPSPPRRRPAAKRRSRSPPLLSLPRSKSWLMILIPETAHGAGHLRHFLAQKDVQALIASTPQIAGILRPLCRMLHIHINAATLQPIPAPLNKPQPPLHPFQAPKPSRADALLAAWLARTKVPPARNKPPWQTNPPYATGAA